MGSVNSTSFCSLGITRPQTCGRSINAVHIYGISCAVEDALPWIKMGGGPVLIRSLFMLCVRIAGYCVITANTRWAGHGYRQLARKLSMRLQSIALPRTFQTKRFGAG